MSEKVMLTAAQAEAIEHFRKNGSSNAGILDNHFYKHYESDMYKRLSDERIDTDILVKALYNGYEVDQPNFEPGDKVITKKGNEIVTLSNPLLNKPAWFLMDDHQKTKWIYTEDIRRVTQEEIYWLETLGRNSVGDIRLGDVYIDSDNQEFLIEDDDDIKHFKKYHDENDFLGIYPAESFKPYPTEDKS